MTNVISIIHPISIIQIVIITIPISIIQIKTIPIIIIIMAILIIMVTLDDKLPNILHFNLINRICIPPTH